MKKTEKNTNWVTPILVAGMMTVSGAALADREFIESGAQHGEHDSFEYAQVIRVTPVYREIKTSVPVKDCWQEPVTRRQVVSHGSHSAGGTLAGGLIGGIIGHQFGNGSGRKLATAVGTIVGAQIGHDATRGSHASTDRSYTSYESVCEVQNQVSYEEVLDSYRVTYRYKGKRYQTQMPYDPGKQLRLRVSVEPVF
jgi:uncharacterized protein YcfJ